MDVTSPFYSILVERKIHISKFVLLSPQVQSSFDLQLDLAAGCSAKVMHIDAKFRKKFSYLQPRYRHHGI